LALYAVPIAFGQSLVAHGATETERLDHYHRHALRQSLALLVPLVALVIALAPFGLRFFGSWYAEHGTTPLRLLALSSLPNAVVALEVSRARVARKMKAVVVVLLGLSVLVLSLTLLLVPRVGITGGGIAWLSGQTAVALGLFGYRQASTIRSRLVRSEAGGVPAAVVQAALTAGDWRPESNLRTVSDSAVVMVRGCGTEAAVLKVAASSNGIESLRREWLALECLHADDRLGSWRSLLPVPLSFGNVSAGAYLVTSKLPGLDGRQAKPGLTNWLTLAAANAIAPLHRLDPATHVLNEPVVSRLVDGPVEALRRAVGSKAVIDRMAAGLRAELDGRWVTLGWTHGDFYAGNVIVSGEGRVTGIVDWAQASRHDLVILDLAFWLLTTPRPGEPHEFGARVAARLGSRQPWLPAETEMMSGRSYNDPISGSALLVLTWLRHVSDNLAKSERYTESPLWLRRNVAPVLRAIEAQYQDTGAPWR
ncbi:MAG: phosphotransferase family protein, partial [Streptosporangiaceae bacterium]